MNLWSDIGPAADLRRLPTQVENLAGATVASVETTETEILVRFEDGRVLRCTSPYGCAEEIMFLLEQPAFWPVSA